MIRNGNPERTSSKDRGVSPVIGVILMVAITVILAAVIGTFVLDLGNNAGKSAPSASLAVTTNINANNVTITHKGGDGLDSAQTRVIVTIDGSKATFNPTSSSHVLSVGGDAVVDVSQNKIDWDPSTAGYEYSSTDTLNTLSSGSQVKVQLIDTESQRVIYETTVTA